MDLFLLVVALPVHEGLVRFVENFLFGQHHIHMFVAFRRVDLLEDFETHAVVLSHILRPVRQLQSILAPHDSI